MTPLLASMQVLLEGTPMSEFKKIDFIKPIMHGSSFSNNFCSREMVTMNFGFLG